MQKMQDVPTTTLQHGVSPTEPVIRGVCVRVCTCVCVAGKGIEAKSRSSFLVLLTVRVDIRSRKGWRWSVCSSFSPGQRRLRVAALRSLLRWRQRLVGLCE